MLFSFRSRFSRGAWKAGGGASLCATWRGAQTGRIEDGSSSGKDLPTQSRSPLPERLASNYTAGATYDLCSESAAVPPGAGTCPADARAIVIGQPGWKVRRCVQGNAPVYLCSCLFSSAFLAWFIKRGISAGFPRDRSATDPPYVAAGPGPLDFCRKTGYILTK